MSILLTCIHTTYIQLHFAFTFQFYLRKWFVNFSIFFFFFFFFFFPHFYTFYCYRFRYPKWYRCGCDECVISRLDDSLRHSRSRINAYRALASPSLIALSSKDPILTAFELSWELRRLSFLEHEFKVIAEARKANTNKHNKKKKKIVKIYFHWTDILFPVAFVLCAYFFVYFDNRMNTKSFVDNVRILQQLYLIIHAHQMNSKWCWIMIQLDQYSSMVSVCT